MDFSYIDLTPQFHLKADSPQPISGANLEEHLFLPKVVHGENALVHLGGDTFRVKNPSISKASFLAYRRSKDIDDKLKIGQAYGSTVQGIDEGDGWVRVEVHQVSRTYGHGPASLTTYSRPISYHSARGINIFGMQPSGQTCPANFKALKARKATHRSGSHRSKDHVRAHSSGTGELPRGDTSNLDDVNGDETQPMSVKVARRFFIDVRKGDAATSHLHCPYDSEFNEERYVSSKRCTSCFSCLDPAVMNRRIRHGTGARNRSPSHQMVLNLIQDLASSLDICEEVLVLCAIYVDKLNTHAAVVLTSANWRTVISVALLIASKIWEDVPLWNADLERALSEIIGIQWKQGAINLLESKFLERLDWKVYISQETYAAYLRSLSQKDVSDILKPSARQIDNAALILLGG